MLRFGVDGSRWMVAEHVDSMEDTPRLESLLRAMHLGGDPVVEGLVEPDPDVEQSPENDPVPEPAGPEPAPDDGTSDGPA